MQGLKNPNQIQVQANLRIKEGEGVLRNPCPSGMDRAVYIC